MSAKLTFFLYLAFFCIVSPRLLVADDRSGSHGSDLELNDNFIQYHYAPPGFEGLDKKSEDGSDVFVIQKGSKAYVSFYSGNEMSFPVRPIKGGNEATRLKFNNIEILSEWDGKELVGRQILFITGREWPSKIIAWTAPELSQAELKTAEKILFSLDVNFVAEE